LLRRDGTVLDAAYSDDLALRLGEAQTAHELPGGGADGPLWICDTAHDLRWPDFARHAAALGIRSMMVQGLPAGRGTRAVLSLYAERPETFDGAAAEVAAVYAEYAADALTRCTAAESLHGALAKRQMIGEATGILMERHRIDSRDAFAMLVRVSKNLNVKLHLVAERVVFTGQDPSTIRGEDFPGRP
jgi:ANTAR domain